MYLNFILTVLCLILLSFLGFGIFLYKKFGNTMSNFKQGPQIPTLGDPKHMEESMKMINSLMKNFPKK
jgi:ABC-type dipeptide/oligopeptide/nickel transport system permease subunit